MFDVNVSATIDAPTVTIDADFPLPLHAEITTDFPAEGGTGLKIADDGEGNIKFVSIGGYKVSDDGDGNVSFGG